MLETILVFNEVSSAYQTLHLFDQQYKTVIIHY